MTAGLGVREVSACILEARPWPSQTALEVLTKGLISGVGVRWFRGSGVGVQVLRRYEARQLGYRAIQVILTQMFHPRSRHSSRGLEVES